MKTTGLNLPAEVGAARTHATRATQANPLETYPIRQGSFQRRGLDRQFSAQAHGGAHPLSAMGGCLGCGAGHALSPTRRPSVVSPPPRKLVIPAQTLRGVLIMTLSIAPWAVSLKRGADYNLAFVFAGPHPTLDASIFTRSSAARTLGCTLPREKTRIHQLCTLKYLAFGLSRFNSAIFV